MLVNIQVPEGSRATALGSVPDLRFSRNNQTASVPTYQSCPLHRYKITIK
jgi:hypothetical protein